MSSSKCILSLFLGEPRKTHWSWRLPWPNTLGSLIHDSVYRKTRSIWYHTSKVFCYVLWSSSLPVSLQRLTKRHQICRGRNLYVPFGSSWYKNVSYEFLPVAVVNEAFLFSLVLLSFFVGQIWKQFIDVARSSNSQPWYLCQCGATRTIRTNSPWWKRMPSAMKTVACPDQ